MNSAAAAPMPGDPLYLPENASLPTRLRIAWHALKILEKDAGNVIAGPLLNSCLDLGVYEKLRTELLQSDDGRMLLADRPTLQGSSLDLAAFRALAPGTLGYEFAKYFQDNGISPFESPVEIRNDLDYLSKRYRETHDLGHVLTGYRTDTVGEMELQAFMVGNLGIRTGLLILTFSSLKRSTFQKVSVPAYLERLHAAYRRGARSPKLIHVHYERFWNVPVHKVCETIGIPPRDEA